jgi:lipopolysaccharide heptosyltransferase II
VSQPEPFADLRALRPERVCLIKPSALGDIVNALPVLSALRERWPNAHLAWVVNQGLRGLLDGHPDLDLVIPFDRAGARLRGLGARNFWRFLRDLRRRRFDLVIDLQGLLRSGIMTAATGAPIRVGRADAREGARRFYTHRVPPPSPGAHAVECLLPIARAFGAEINVPRFVLPINNDDRRWARDTLAVVPRPRLVLNMGAKWPTKRWPPAHFAEIARRAASTFGAGLITVGAPEDRPIVDAFHAYLDNHPVLDLCAQTTLPRLAAVAVESDLMLSNDTGPLHLAAAAGARVVGIYTCTSPELNGPYSPTAVVVRTGIWCSASYLSRCNRLDCMSELTPGRVWGAVRRQLALRSEPQFPAVGS